MPKRTLLALLAGLAALTATPAAAPASVTNDQIAFARQLPTGGANIYTVTPDGSNAQQVPLVDTAEDFGIPIWSPDRSRLLISTLLRFDATGNLLPFRPATVAADGSDFTVLDPPSAPPDMYCGTWSAVGTRVLCGFGGDEPGVFSIRGSDGGDPVRLTTNPYGDNPYGAGDIPTDTSPDGSRFVFLRYRPVPPHGDPKPIAQQVALFTARLDGSAVRQLTPYGLAQAHEFAAAQWSPDGREIVSETTQGRLFVVHPDGAGLTPIHLQTGTTQYFAFAPDWSPDGTRIVFCMFIDGQEDIYTAKADGSDLVRVTNTPDFENGPDWGRNPVEP